MAWASHCCGAGRDCARATSLTLPASQPKYGTCARRAAASASSALDAGSLSQSRSESSIGPADRAPVACGHVTRPRDVVGDAGKPCGGYDLEQVLVDRPKSWVLLPGPQLADRHQVAHTIESARRSDGFDEAMEGGRHGMNRVCSGTNKQAVIEHCQPDSRHVARRLRRGPRRAAGSGHATGTRRASRLSAGRAASGAAPGPTIAGRGRGSRRR